MANEAAIKIDEKKVTSLTVQANAIVIRDQGSYDRAVEFLKSVKGLREEIKTTYKDVVVAAAYESYKLSLGFFQRNDEPLAQAETRIKGLILSFDREKKAAEEKRQREADEKARREAQEKADKIAAELKAKADREAKEAKDRADREAAEAKKAGASKAEVAEIKKEAEKKVEAIKGSIEQELAEIQASVEHVSAAEVRPSYERAAGIGTSKNWDGEVTDLPALLLYIVRGMTSAGPVVLAHPELLPLIAVDQAGVRRLAKAQEEHFKVPGARAFDKGRVAASRF